MALLGTLLRNRHPDERNYAWSQTNLTAPGTLAITSRDFTDGPSRTTARWQARRRREPLPAPGLERAAVRAR